MSTNSFERGQVCALQRLRGLELFLDQLSDETVVCAAACNVLGLIAVIHAVRQLDVARGRTFGSRCGSVSGWVEFLVSDYILLVQVVAGILVALMLGADSRSDVAGVAGCMHALRNCLRMMVVAKRPGNLLVGHVDGCWDQGGMEVAAATTMLRKSRKDGLVLR